MGKTVAELFKDYDCTILGNPDEVVSGLKYRSDRVNEHDLFFCIVGFKVDGHSFAQDAIDHGATVIVAERKIYLADATNVTEVIVSDSRDAMAVAAANFYDDPSDDFDLVGITGTNGKTTTTYLLEHIARERGLKTGVIGTVGIRIGDEKYETSHTTPESPDLQETFSHMSAAHCDVVAMEVSSHALDLKRTWDSSFAVTAFTNLSQDHLDYHHTFEAYFEAKAELFSKNYPAKRVICIDDKWGKELHNRCSHAGDDVITTGFDPMAQICCLSYECAPAYTKVNLDVRGRKVEFEYPLVGPFNIENVMTAMGIAIQLGYSLEEIIDALHEVPQIPGRLERVHANHDGGVSVFVDYAHTPDALEKALDSIIDLTDGKTFVVFGCGGDRDASKRSIMGEVSLSADYPIVTSDNPRSEDPLAIIEDIVSGMTDSETPYVVEPDRAQAIKYAIEHACEGDSILIAGKGHEDYQIVGTEKLHFDDRETAAKLLEETFGA